LAPIPVTLLRIAAVPIAYAVVGVPALQLAIPRLRGADISSCGHHARGRRIYGYGVLPAAFFGSLL